SRRGRTDATVVPQEPAPSTVIRMATPFLGDVAPLRRDRGHHDRRTPDASREYGGADLFNQRHAWRSREAAAPGKPFPARCRRDRGPAGTRPPPPPSGPAGAAGRP